MRCKKCMIEWSSKCAGQAFTKWTCKICGKEEIHPNTAAPKVCDDCSKKYHVCTDCGNSIIDNT